MTESTEPRLQVERRLELDVSVERVWRALTDPEELARWFPDRVDQAGVAAGAEGQFIWEEHGKYAFRIEAFEPPYRLAWRWARDPGLSLTETVATQVEWILESRPDGGTTLRLCESGFVRVEDREGNAKGWDAELGELVELLAG